MVKLNRIRRNFNCYVSPAIVGKIPGPVVLVRFGIYINLNGDTMLKENENDIPQADPSALPYASDHDYVECAGGSKCGYNADGNVCHYYPPAKTPYICGLPETAHQKEARDVR